MARQSAEYYRQYREKNRERLRAYRREWNEKNKEKVRARKQELYWADPEKHRAKAGEYRAKNVDRRREYDRAYWARNPNKRRDKDKRDQHRRRAAVWELKAGAPCADCGQKFHPVCMDFDHVRGTKVKCVGALTAGSSMKTLMDEIAKCELVCANCHRLRTWKRRQTAYWTPERKRAATSRPEAQGVLGFREPPQ